MSQLSTTDADREEMLAVIGVSSVDELFRDIPAGVRFQRELDLEPALSEPELNRHLEELAAKNVDTNEELSFLGMGIYDHYVPAVVDAVLQRGEFLTAYTPYQPEMSQGVLQAIFEYQTAICELTAMDVSNASGYDGTTVAADACLVAKHATGRAKVVLAETLNPQVRQVVKTYAIGFGLDVVEVPHADGLTDPAAVRDAAEDAAAVIFQQPNVFGILEHAPELAAAAKEAGALAIAHVDPISLGVLEAPGNYGADLAIGEGQSVGNYQSYAGPHYGFLASKAAFTRRLPGRIIGETTDLNGDRGYVLTLQTREQHIRREKATSNMTTNQTLLALAGLVQLSWLGPQGLREVGETCMGLGAYAKQRLGLPLAFPDRPTFKEFAVRLKRPARDVIREARAHGVHPGYAIGRDYEGMDDVLLIAVTEKRSPADIDRLAHVLHEVQGLMELIYEKSKPGRRASTVPRYDVPAAEVPEHLRRAEPPRLPELAEPELVRHFTELSTRNFGIDTGFYPLGSCTMKHNPRINERLAMLPGFKDLHPHQDEDGAQGALELMWRLQEILQEVAGLDACSLQPAAGSQGELTGLMLMRAYFADIGEGDQRDTIITADTAHGTNPASVTMAGYKLEKVATDARGNLDVDDLRAKVNERTAGLMLTNPSTLGLFDENIEEVAGIFHDAGSLLYYDGANLNAVCGISRPGDMGFDIVHINLHKTFSQPHGGGGPGGGPIVVRKKLEPFLPVPAVVRDGDRYGLDHDRPKSIGKVRGFTGPFGVFVRSYAYIRSYGPALREMSETAVLNANYLLAQLRDAYDLPYDRLAMHEFVLSARTLKREHGVSALDIAKRLMDYGYHPPTIYFPLVVPEALMIEPTETEPKERLDAFVEAMLAIAGEAAETPELLKEAPTSRPVRRLDEVKAAKRAVVKYGFDEHPDLSGEPAEVRQLEAQKGA